MVTIKIQIFHVLHGYGAPTDGVELHPAAYTAEPGCPLWSFPNPLLSLNFSPLPLMQPQ